jgi:phosphonoacetate hydrolase
MRNLKGMECSGSSVQCSAVTPTVTNVNNASILTAKFPADHGITGNYYFDRATKSTSFMNMPEFLRCDTILDEALRLNLRTAFLTVKEKLRTLLGSSATISFSVEVPSPELIQEIGRPPNIYSLDSSIWLLDAVLWIIEKQRPDITYVATTDFVPHMFSPRSEEAEEYMAKVDERLGLLMERHTRIGIVSDHGMNDKSLKVDLAKILAEKKMETTVIPIIKDEHVRHHRNLGGAVYLYMDRRLDEARRTILDVEGVEAVFTAAEAEKRYRLPRDRIGDLFVLGDERTVFGEVENGVYEDVTIRSHGSLHEQVVPLILNRKVKFKGEVFNKDVFGHLRGV